jgi:anti-sigma factor RsiW
MDVLSHFLTRRRIGAYLDGGLNARDMRATEAHLTRCATCRRTADALRRLREALQRSLTPRDPDWTGFWQGVVRGIETDRLRAPAPERARRAFGWRPRWALGGAVAAALAVSITLWQGGGRTPMLTETPIVVNNASTAHPDGSVMVYSTPDKAVTVVWVFEGD